MSNENPQATPGAYQRADLDTIISAYDQIKDFEKFLLTRFAAYTRYTTVTDERGRAVDPVEDPFARTNSGYGHWRLPTNWLMNLRRDLTMLDPANAQVTVEEYVAGDRGPGSVAHTVKVPLSFIFGDDEREAQRAEFLRLKAIFEPDTDATSDSTAGTTDPSRVPLRNHRARVEAARYLYVQSKPEAQRTHDGTRLAQPEHRAEAAQAYREALHSLMTSPSSGELKDVRRRVHASAEILGLGEEDLREPTDSDQSGIDPETPAEQAGEALGQTLLDAIAARARSLGEAVDLSTDKAETVYEKARAALVLKGDAMFGPQNQQVIEVIDDVADLLGLKKKP